MYEVVAVGNKKPAVERASRQPYLCQLPLLLLRLTLTFSSHF